MSIVLSPDVERQIEEMVRSGRFESAEQCVSTCIGVFQYFEKDQKESLARMQAHGKDVRLRVKEGLAALEQGNFFDYDDVSLQEFIDRVKREAREVRARGERR
jgi:Arc/MetJ-type ribon-helix-helix transcriptional regulator